MLAHLESATPEHVFHDPLHVPLANQKVHVRLGLPRVTAEVGQAVRRRGHCGTTKRG